MFYRRDRFFLFKMGIRDLKFIFVAHEVRLCTANSSFIAQTTGLCDANMDFVSLKGTLHNNNRLLTQLFLYNLEVPL